MSLCLMERLCSSEGTKGMTQLCRVLVTLVALTYYFLLRIDVLIYSLHVVNNPCLVSFVNFVFEMK